MTKHWVLENISVMDSPRSQGVFVVINIIIMIIIVVVVVVGALDWPRTAGTKPLSRVIKILTDNIGHSHGHSQA